MATASLVLIYGKILLFYPSKGHLGLQSSIIPPSVEYHIVCVTHDKAEALRSQGRPQRHTAMSGQSLPSNSGPLAPIQLYTHHIASNALLVPTPPPTPVMEPSWVGLATERLQAWLEPEAHGNWAIFLGRK